MAIDTAEKRRNVAGNMPIPDGTISIFDRRQIAGNYRGLPIGVLLDGSLTPTGALGRALTAYRALDGAITPTGDVGRTLTAYLSIGGTLVATGTVGSVTIFVISLGGVLAATGGIAIANPAWLIIDDNLNWQGAWSATAAYEANDAVLYQSGDNIHLFVSKVTHNTGNTPSTQSAWWSRGVQVPWLKGGDA